MSLRLYLALTLLAAGQAPVAAADTAVERWYTWSLRGQPCGYLHIVRKSCGDNDMPILLTHHFVITHRGKRLTLAMQTYCKADACLTPVRIVSKGEGDDELATFDAAITWDADGGILRTEINGRPREIPLPLRTVTDFALFDVVQTLPFKDDTAFAFHSLEASELGLKRDHTLRYLGVQDVEIGGKTMPLHHFEQTGGGIRPARYWLDGEHRLVRIVIDDRKELLLSTRDQAIAAAERAQPAQP